MLNYIDVLLILLIILNVWLGWQRGFILGAFDLFRWTGSLLIAFRFYPLLSEWLSIFIASEEIWLPPLSFLTTFFFANYLFYLCELSILKKLPERFHLKKINKLLGGIPGLINGIVLSAIAAVTILAFPLIDGLRFQVRNSTLTNELAKPAEEVETAISPIFDKAVNKTLNRLTVSEGTEKFIHLPYKVIKTVPAPELEEQMLELINEEREVEGIQPLKADIELRVVARYHSNDMFKRGYFSHYTPEGKDPFERMESFKVIFRTAGENLALAPTLSLAHSGLMKSPGHRANILQKKFNRVGIGVIDGGTKGLMITQNFRD